MNDVLGIDDNNAAFKAAFAKKPEYKSVMGGVHRRRNAVAQANARWNLK